MILSNSDRLIPSFKARSINILDVTSTFFADLSIAECFGEKELKDTYKKILEHWKYDIKYITEFSMCLNHKIWQLRHIDKKMSLIYDELWKKSIDFVEKTYKDKDLEYFYEITD